MEQRRIRTELYNDNFQNFKRYNIPKAQLVIADIPYNLGANAFASSTEWYINGDNKQGESKKAGKAFFKNDYNFNLAEYMHFCSRLLKKEPKQTNSAPAMIVFCSFEQMPMIIEYGKKHGFKKSYPLIFIKNYSSQVLKANMKIVGATEYAVVLYRDKLPKFRNGGKVKENGRIEAGTGKMVFNWFNWERDNKNIYPKVHPTQKPIGLLKELIQTFTDAGDVVIDPVAGSGSTLRACKELNRHSYGFEVDKKFYNLAVNEMLKEEDEQQIDMINYLN